jgi:hypothetical protein
MISGEFKGRDAIVKMLSESPKATEGAMKFEVAEILASNDHAVAIIHGIAKRKGLSTEGPSTFGFHLSNGKVEEVWVHGDTSLRSGTNARALPGKNSGDRPCIAKLCKETESGECSGTGVVESPLSIPPVFWLKRDFCLHRLVSCP